MLSDLQRPAQCVGSQPIDCLYAISHITNPHWREHNTRSRCLRDREFGGKCLGIAIPKATQVGVL